MFNKMNILVVFCVTLLLSACGKNVDYQPPEVPKTGHENCVTPINCQTPGGGVNQAPQPLELIVTLTPSVPHNRLLCTDVQVEGHGRDSLGCNDGTELSKVYTVPALTAPGDDARLKVWYMYDDSTTSYVTTFRNHTGHFKMCQTTGPQVWLDFEDHLNVEDYDDSRITVESVGGEPLRLEQGLDGHLYIVWEE